jgi:hypothetical protein
MNFTIFKRKHDRIQLLFAPKIKISATGILFIANRFSILSSIVQAAERVAMISPKKPGVSLQDKNAVHQETSLKR